MGYATNVNIQYSAVAATPGFVAGDHTLTWNFSDTTQQVGASVVKSWYTAGIKSATVTAVNNVTLGSATALVNENVAFGWTADPISIIPAWTNNFLHGTFGVAIDGSTMLFIGSRTDANQVIGNSCYLYNTASRTLVQTGSIPNTRVAMSLFSACALANGDVIISGGYVSGSGINAAAKLAYRYSRVNGTWSQLNDRSYPSEYANPYSSQLLPNGKMYSAVCQTSYGGYDEIYDPTTGLWTTLPARPFGAYQRPSVALLSSGLIFRGTGVNESDAGCNLYNYLNNTWSSIADCPYVSAEVLPILNATKLIAIPYDGVSSTLPTQIYDPANNTWVAGPTLTKHLQLEVGHASLLGPNRIGYAYTNTQFSVLDSNRMVWDTYPETNASHKNPFATYLNGYIWVAGSSDGSAPYIEYI